MVEVLLVVVRSGVIIDMGGCVAVAFCSDFHENRTEKVLLFRLRFCN